MNIQWYPGHMTKTRRQMADYIKQVDAVCELTDARIPQVSRNPDMDTIAQGKPRVLILNRVDLADPAVTRLWAAHFRAQGMAVLETNSRTGAGITGFAPAVRAVLADKIEQWKAKGQTGRVLRVMVVGIPNVGKSTFINRLIGRRSAKAADKPGVTRGSQWFRVAEGIDLLDTPGILWSKFEEERVGVFLAFTGAIRDDILDIETLGCKLMECLAVHAPAALQARYGLTVPVRNGATDTDASSIWNDADVSRATPVSLGYDLLLQAGRKRGFLLRGGEIDTERMAHILLDEFRDGTLGRITLEWPKENTTYDSYDT